MNRKQKRKLTKESKAFRELLKVVKHFFKDFFEKLDEVEDLRHQSYITYNTAEILFVALLTHLMTMRSMRSMTAEFNKEECIENIKKVLDNYELEELPHHDTINDFLEILGVDDLKKIRTYMIKELFKKRCFGNDRYLNKYWLIAFDATGIHSFKERHCPHCLKKVRTNKKTGEETVTYYHNVLEAKLIVGDFVFSIATEFVENEDENITKQNCELKAFYRLEKRVKEDFPRLPICIVLDSLYACEPVMSICKENNWEYLIRFKKGSIKTVAEEFEVLSQLDNKNQKEAKNKRVKQEYTWVNDISYQEHSLNIVEIIELKDAKKTKFVFLSSIRINNRNVVTIGKFGRKRWKIENEGFNVQKNGGYELEHLYSEDPNGMKNHYLLTQIAHIIRQLYDKGVKKLKLLKSSIKRMSSLLLEAFRNTTLTGEDIQYVNQTKIQVRFTT
jgi:hypothetical protein